VPKNWNKGHTKKTHPSLEKTSNTMRLKRIDNFKIWRDRMKMNGKIRSKYIALKKNRDLAELIGVVLGDGHIGKFPRCESLRIVGNYKNKGFINRYAKLVEDVFKKIPTVSKIKASNASTITIYENKISQRLGIPVGSRRDLQYKLPLWIKRSKKNRISFLRGLYEAEGSINHHEKTYTHKLLFSNKNESLLNLVQKLVLELGFAPHYSRDKVQISRKNDVQKLKNLLKFRSY